MQLFRENFSLAEKENQALETEKEQFVIRDAACAINHHLCQMRQHLLLQRKQYAESDRE